MAPRKRQLGETELVRATKQAKTEEGGVSKDDTKRGYSKLRYNLQKEEKKGNTEPLKLFREASWNVKAEWLDKFRIDPSMAWLEGETKTQCGASSSNHASLQWLTPEQLSGPSWLNSSEHVRLLMDSKLLKSRPHELKPLADAGVRQVEWHARWKTMEDSATGQVFGFSLRNKSD